MLVPTGLLVLALLGTGRGDFGVEVNMQLPAFSSPESGWQPPCSAGVGFAPDALCPSHQPLCFTSFPWGREELNFKTNPCLSSLSFAFLEQVR